MKVLIIGGNRFFGKRLAENLSQQKHNVTLLNRGNIEDGLGGNVQRITCDRTNNNALLGKLNDSGWDIVYDQVCFDYETAKAACAVFSGKTKKYVFTSSQSVYGAGKDLKEDDFQPGHHKVDKLESNSSNYGEAKRQAEVAFTKYATFPVINVRFPIVIGHDDFTGRFKFHVERMTNKQPIYFPNIDAKISFVTSAFAAKTLAYFADNDFEGQVNAASPNPISLRDFIRTIENVVGETMVSGDNSTEEQHSPYGIEKDWYMNCDRLNELGLRAPEISEWLPAAVSAIAP